MPNLPIAPDESGDVPRCSQRCLHFVGQSFDTYITCAIGDREQLRGSPCLPRVRELVAISRRRCDGCRHSKPLQGESDVFCHLWRIRQNPGGHCNEWAAKR